ncbi:MAG: hypothetical protein BWY57_00003 [Betaproteobacteria bacterium ADurb.Bin341]|nr:MAG: hypothetical protein BWY57_00003 [Betaproteobacteria bacterium ADurb.Bin341]
MFQPFDRGDVEMIGRLIKQQDFGRGHQRLRQGQPFLLAAGKRANRSLGIETKALDGAFGL